MALWAFPAWLVMNHRAWIIQSEGSPAGTIWFSIVGGVGMLFIVAAACA